MENKIISIDLYSGFGFLKKPDINEDIYLTYNCLHKPALLGILGAITGLKGHYQAFIERKKEPEYSEVFKELQVGIQPNNSKNGTFAKTTITYNNSVGYASKEEGGNLIIKEQTLLNPSYKIYLLIDFSNHHQKELYESLKSDEAYFIPYLGKNDFQISWNGFEEYDCKPFNYNSSFQIESIFKKEKVIKTIRGTNEEMLDGEIRTPSFTFSYFERLPVGFSEITGNYELAEFAFTDFLFPSNYEVSNLFEIIDSENNKKVIQLF